MKKKLLSLMLAMAMLVGIIPISTSAASYWSDWKYWSQGASDIENLRNYGCRVVAQSKMLMEMGVASGGFNPDQYYNWGLANGCFNSGMFEIAEKGVSPVKYAIAVGKPISYGGIEWFSGKSQAEKAQIVMNYINNGYYVMTGSDGTSHYAYILRQDSLNAGHALISDSYYNSSGINSIISNFATYNGYNFNYLLYFSGPSGTIPIEPNITFTGIVSGSYQDLGNYQADANIDAYFHTNGSTISQVGFYLWETYTDTLIARHVEETGEFASIPVIKGTFGLRSELGIELKTGTHYTYQMIAVVNGKEYLSEKNYLQTIGSAPPLIDKPVMAELSLSRTEFFIGDSVTFTCQADVESDFVIWISREGQAPLAKNISATYTTTFQETGTYTAYITAFNDAGAIVSPKITFHVSEPNVTPPDPILPEPYPGTPFTDISGHWGKESIKWAYTENLFSGTSVDKFSPNNSMSRGMLATVLYRLKGSPSVSGDSGFWDVGVSQYYAKPVKWAADNKIVSGMGGGSFALDSSITREQLAVMLHNYEIKFGNTGGSSAGLSQFTDGGAVSAWAQDAVRWAVSQGILSGKGDGRLDPKGTATRAEVASMLYRFAS